MLMQAIWFIVGLAGLYYAAEWLVRGASRIARSMGVTPVIVGLTIVAFGTSAPELVVSAVAAARGQSDVAIGNVVGSNIMNIALILGICGLIAPMRVDRSFIRREIPIMLGVAILLPAFGWDGVLGRFDAFLLLIAFIGFVASQVHAARSEPEDAQEEFRAYEELSGYEPAPGERMWFNAGLVVVGILGLLVSAHLLVTSAVFFARQFGVSELVVGLTIIAIGTSLPELATSIVAARRSEPEIALGNVIGSNIFNILLILGASSAIRPITVASSLMRFEIPVMIGLSAALIPMMYPRKRFGRVAATVLLVVYAAFTVFLVANARA